MFRGMRNRKQLHGQRIAQVVDLGQVQARVDDRGEPAVRRGRSEEFARAREGVGFRREDRLHVLGGEHLAQGRDDVDGRIRGGKLWIELDEAMSDLGQEDEQRVEREAVLRKGCKCTLPELTDLDLRLHD